MELSWSVTCWISNSNESKRTVHELNAWLCSSANPLKQYHFVYKMIHKQKEQHHQYQISSTNEHAVALAGFHLNQNPRTQHWCQRGEKKLQNGTNEERQLQSHQSDIALGKFCTASHCIYRIKAVHAVTYGRGTGDFLHRFRLYNEHNLFATKTFSCSI